MGLLAAFAVGCVVVGAIAAWERYGYPWGLCHGCFQPFEER
jgi:hypothetical protein